MPKHAKDTERAAECQRLIEELRPFYEDELNDWEKTFITDMDERLTKYGEGTYVSYFQFAKLSEIYERVIG